MKAETVAAIAVVTEAAIAVVTVAETVAVIAAVTVVVIVAILAARAQGRKQPTDHQSKKNQQMSLIDETTKRKIMDTKIVVATNEMMTTTGGLHPVRDLVHIRAQDLAPSRLTTDGFVNRHDLSNELFICLTGIESF